MLCISFSFYLRNFCVVSYFLDNGSTTSSLCTNQTSRRLGCTQLFFKKYRHSNSYPRGLKLGWSRHTSTPSTNWAAQSLNLCIIAQLTIIKNRWTSMCRFNYSSTSMVRSWVINRNACPFQICHMLKNNYKQEHIARSSISITSPLGPRTRCIMF